MQTPSQTIAARLQRDPVCFCRHILGVEPWGKQVEVLRGLRDHDRVAVRSGHGTGKSFIASCAALWFLYSFYPAKVVTTAPTQNQVRDILWSEIRRLYARARVPLGGKALEERIRLGDDAFAVGVSTDTPERFQGFHSEHLLVILDEAPGVREEIWEAAETLLTGRVGKILAIGNPTRPRGLFYNAFAPGSDWHTLRISCLDSPNLRVPEGTPPPYPRLVTPRWIESRRRDWGEESPLWQSRILGEFPDDAGSTLIPRTWIETAAARLPAQAHPSTTTAHGDGSASATRYTLGVDVARTGTDLTVFCLRDGGRIERLEARQGWSTMETAGRVVALIREFGLEAERVCIDDTGLGAGVTDRLRELGHEVTAFVAAGRAVDPVHFANRRAEVFWRVRSALAPDAEDPLVLPSRTRHAQELQRELGALSYEFTSTGAVRIADKVTLRGRLAGSPNYADALALSYADPATDDDARLLIV